MEIKRAILDSHGIFITKMPDELQNLVLCTCCHNANGAWTGTQNGYLSRDKLFHTVQLPTTSKPKVPKDLNFTNSITPKLAIQIAFLSKLLDLQPWFLPSPSPHGGHVVFQTLCFPERHGPFDEPAQTLDPYWHPRWRPNSLFFSTTSVRGGWGKDESFGVPGLLRKAHLPSSNSDPPIPSGTRPAVEIT